jgi:hypothetical protein
MSSARVKEKFLWHPGDVQVTRPPSRAAHQHSVTWDDVAAVVELSAKTAMLEVTPAPYGKPGGPGLYGVAGNKHSDYFEQIVKALTEKRGMDKGKASQVAWGVLRKWAGGGGKVHPEVRAAAAGALAKEAAAGALAKGSQHAASWDQVSRAVELATVMEFFNPAQQRVPVGQLGGGQFAPAGSGGQAAGKQQPKGKTAAKKPDAHQLHVAHVAHVNKVSTQKAGLLVTAQDDTQKANALIKQRDVLAKELASASGATSSGQSGSTTSSNATTSSSAPAAASTTASTASTASTSSPASTTASSTPAASTPAASTSTSASAATTAGIKAQISKLNTQITQLQAAAKQATAQAAKLK